MKFLFFLYTLNPIIKPNFVSYTYLYDQKFCTLDFNLIIYMLEKYCSNALHKERKETPRCFTEVSKSRYSSLVLVEAPIYMAATSPWFAAQGLSAL
jgi:hypothetical protein